MNKHGEQTSFQTADAFSGETKKNKNYWELLMQCKSEGQINYGQYEGPVSQLRFNEHRKENENNMKYPTPVISGSLVNGNN